MAGQGERPLGLPARRAGILTETGGRRGRLIAPRPPFGPAAGEAGRILRQAPYRRVPIYTPPAARAKPNSLTNDMGSPIKAQPITAVTGVTR